MTPILLHRILQEKSREGHRNINLTALSRELDLPEEELRELISTLAHIQALCLISDDSVRLTSYGLFANLQ